MQLYTILSNHGCPLSTWDEPETLKEILDRYYEQYLDFEESPSEDQLTRKEFTAELFQDLWDCELVKFNDGVDMI